MKISYFMMFTVIGFSAHQLLQAADTEQFRHAQELQQAGKKDEAIVAYQKTLAFNPRHFGALFALGNELFSQERFQDAITYYTKAHTLQPTSPQINYNIGITLQLMGKIDDAITYFEQAIKHNPHYTKGIKALIALYRKTNAPEKTIPLYKTLLELEPSNAATTAQFGRVLRDQGNHEEAIKLLCEALALNPRDLTLYFELGYLYTTLGRTQEAANIYLASTKLQPNNPQTYYNIGYALKMEGNVDEALKYYDKALELDPNYDHAHFAMGHSYLHKGDFENGWKKHSRYLKKAGKNADELRALIDEDNLDGKVILLKPEGGLGDTLQFIRYAQELKNRGAIVVAAVQKCLTKLLSYCPYIDKVMPIGAQSPRYQAISTLMSLPAVFNSNEETIPRNIPYLFSDPELEQLWQEALIIDTKFKIGICWQADVHNDVSRLPVAHRGISLSKYYPLANFNNVSLYSLQKYDGVEQLKDVPDYFKVHVFAEDFDKTHGSFMDTAAVMKSLDLIITVDTAIAHLAGGLGKPVWLLLPFSTDWRWIAGRSDTPWYPNMRIFKQTKPFDWDSVMQRVFAELENLLSTNESS